MIEIIPSDPGGAIELATIIDVTDTEAFLVRKDADGGDIFVVDTTNGTVAIGGVTPVAGTRLLLPLEDEAATPTLAFGNGDTGFYERTDDVLSIACGGSIVFDISNGAFADGITTTGNFLILRETASNINPLYSFHGDSNTGLGRAAGATLSLIANGTESIRANTATNAVNFLDITPSATTDAVVIATDGTDTNIDLALSPKGTGGVGIGISSPDGLLDLRDGNLVLSNATVGHSLTSIAATNVYGQLYPNMAANGGLVIDGLTDAGTVSGVTIRGFHGIADPTDAVGAVSFRSGKWDGATGTVQMGDAETAYQFSNHDNSVKFLTIMGGGNVFINETLNSKMSLGLTINQGANDDEIISLKSSDVGHGMTSLTEADTFGLIKKLYVNNGGLNITGLSDGDNTALMFNAYIGSNNPADSMAATIIRAQKYDGATSTDPIGSAETAFKVQNQFTDLFNILGNGNATIAGYTKLGSDAPVIKMKKLTGTTAAAEGGTTSVAHGLTADKILTVGLKIEYSANNYVQDEYLKDAEFQASIQWENTNINVKNHNTNSANILSKAFTVLLTYEE